MVLIHMKSTMGKDEFLVGAACDTSVNALTAKLARMQNLRVRLQSQGMACYNLASEKPHMDGRPDDARRLEQLYSDSKALLDPQKASRREQCTEEELAGMVAGMEAAAKELFPDHCVDPPAAAVPEDKQLDEMGYDDLLTLAKKLHDAGVPGVAEGVDDEPAARETLRKARQPPAVTKLWQMRDDPDIGEDLRLRVWYWLELVDPFFKERDFVDEKEAQLWTCGKAVKREDVLGAYVPGRANEKTKLTCKLTAKEAKGCPARDSRMSFDDQRQYRQRMERKREEWKTLEASELAQHRNVNPQRGDFVGFRAPGSDGGTYFREGKDAAGVVPFSTDVKRIHDASRVEHLMP